MKNKIIQFEVSSPDELRAALASHVKDGERFAAVRVFGPQVLTRQFHFPKSSVRDLVLGLKLEASETLSVTALDVEASYQVTGTDEQGMYGVFSAITRTLLTEYLDCFNGHHLIPISLMTSAIGVVADFLKDHPSSGENYCLVNFIRPHVVNIIVFSEGKPAFFRELHDLNDDDLGGKITDTIRYSCGRSSSKKIEHIFFTGDLAAKDDLIKRLKEMEDRSSGQSAAVLPTAYIDLAGLNLFKNQILGLYERTKLVSILSLISVVSVLLGFILAWHLLTGSIVLRDARSKMIISGYNQALKLQEQIRRNNGK